MLILVGVSVSILINSNLIGVAEDAANKTKTSYGEEGNMSGVTIGGTKYDSIEDYLNNNSTSSIKIKLSMVNTPTPVTADGTKVSSITQGAPIPVDFYYVGGTMNTGIVISDSSADENAGVDADLQGNQFVWVPVLQNQKLKIEIESEEEITSIKIEDGLNNEITTDKEGNTIAPSGTSYTVEVNPTINGLYTVTVTAGEKTIEETLDVTSLYAQDFFIEETVEGLIVQLELMAASQNMTVDEFLALGVIPGVTSVADLPGDLMTGFAGYSDTTIATYSESVNKYGGFYIARYEAGSENARTDSSDTSDTVYSKKNKYPYNIISQTNAITKAAGMYSKTNVTSALINAAAWDRTLNWLVETKAITVNSTTNELVDSTNWGNYNNSTFEFIGKYYSSSWTEVASSTSKPGNKSYLLGTGVSDYTERNNIYDLAGNCGEWTTEAGSSGVAAIRGAGYNTSGDNGPASTRISREATGRGPDVSFRPVLYINQ